ncbi:hypothetical protein [Candidatus Parabeggiatoa sp. HSG14]|uniref:hypothetical protein n=1 Tax=Candidatus Parabeggiatoa sp. HSG14 TaxID=3055593 RepID=UPI0025A8831A|nr:hypothetical protein [Thiotrichales bacterium HSG14]
MIEEKKPITHFNGIAIKSCIAWPVTLMKKVGTISNPHRIITYDPKKNEDVEYYNLQGNNRVYLEEGIYASYTGGGSFVIFYLTEADRQEAKKCFQELQKEKLLEEFQVPKIMAEFDFSENSQITLCLYLEADRRGIEKIGNGVMYGVILNPKVYNS